MKRSFVSAPAKNDPSYSLLKSIVAAAVFLFIVLGAIGGYLENWLWMRELNYAGIFWTLLSVKWAMFCSAFVFAFLYLWIRFLGSMSVFTSFIFGTI